MAKFTITVTFDDTDIGWLEQARSEIVSGSKTAEFTINVTFGGPVTDTTGPKGVANDELGVEARDAPDD